MKKKYIIIFLIISIILLFLILNKKNKNKIAFYTVFIGSNNNKAFKSTTIPSNFYDCYYYTNNKEIIESLKGTKWIIKYLDIEVSNDEIKSCMDAKHVKILPNLYNELNKYEYTVFFDNKLEIHNNIYEIERLIDIKMSYTPILIRRHELIGPKVLDEYKAAMNQPRYKKQSLQYMNYINNQVSKGLSLETKDHFRCGFIIRKNSSPVVKNINETWYKHLIECGIEDQISFFFVKQLFLNDIGIIEHKEFTIP
jgi:hypothetical protein